MGLSTHVLDTANGCPAAGMHVSLRTWDGSAWQPVTGVTLNSDGRAPGGPLVSNDALRSGRYQLIFAVGDYFRARGTKLPEPAFLEQVPIEFGVADPHTHYHVPLLCSPFGFSTYRGS